MFSQLFTDCLALFSWWLRWFWFSYYVYMITGKVDASPVWCGYVDQSVFICRRCDGGLVQPVPQSLLYPTDQLQAVRMDVSILVSVKRSYSITVRDLNASAWRIPDFWSKPTSACCPPPHDKCFCTPLLGNCREAVEGWGWGATHEAAGWSSGEIMEEGLDTTWSTSAADGRGEQATRRGGERGEETGKETCFLFQAFAGFAMLLGCELWIYLHSFHQNNLQLSSFDYLVLWQLSQSSWFIST